ncbi:hypothetical protein Cni_G02859 [Canna indica]|uniref:Cyclin N-terminal domain-containing protein n=1 Tax=Canna indica TaxID=4628 RepID=A0AAQ3JS23_9LILI|nr:hypothetical protein Cni_G02859 [Canna indica]
MPPRCRRVWHPSTQLPLPGAEDEEDHLLPPLLLFFVLHELEEERFKPPPLLPNDGETVQYVLFEAEAKEEWAEVLRSLTAKDGESLYNLVPHGGDDSYLRSSRKVAVKWVARAVARHDFSALSALLVVNYLDRCFLPCAGGNGLLRLQEDKPWMGWLAAVACHSLAAKVEETRAPLLVDL